ncbi:hypothetical protein ABTF53_19860, partial [Acinetobacter baumannii]
RFIPIVGRTGVASSANAGMAQRQAASPAAMSTSLFAFALTIDTCLTVRGSDEAKGRRRTALQNERSYLAAAWISAT